MATLKEREIRTWWRFKNPSWSLLQAHGRVALHYAAKNACLEAVQLLLAAGAQVGPRDHEGRTPMRYAVAASALRVANHLLMATALFSSDDTDASTAKDTADLTCGTSTGTGKTFVSRTLGSYFYRIQFPFTPLKTANTPTAHANAHSPPPRGLLRPPAAAPAPGPP